MTKVEKINNLKSNLKDLEVKLKNTLLEQGEACGSGCDWHDNNAYDLATSLAQTYQSMISEIKKEIKEIQNSK